MAERPMIGRTTASKVLPLEKNTIGMQHPAHLLAVPQIPTSPRQPPKKMTDEGPADYLSMFPADWRFKNNRYTKTPSP